MGLREENIKLIFGIKLRQLRHEKKLSLSQLSQMTGISISYLNEIEKGKKYPKADKIAIISNVLNTDYDYLVSLHLSKKLSPIADLLKSNILGDLPLDVYGIDKRNLIELLSDAPLKLSAFISTIIQISRNYDMTVENFYLAVLTSYIEMNNNYFESIENSAEEFIAEFGAGDGATVTEAELATILKEEYGYQVNDDFLSFHDYLHDQDSVYKPGSPPVLFVNKSLNSKQRAFVYGLELGYNYLKLKERPFSASLLEVRSFEEALNHYKASYFASALLMNKDQVAQDLRGFFQHTRFREEELLKIKAKYNASTEIFVSRLANIIPRFFKINEVFLFVFNHQGGSPDYTLVKEIHLSGLHSPHANLQAEYYCRRWKGISLIKELEEMQAARPFEGPLCGIQKSRHISESNNEYLIITLARSKTTVNKESMSISIGMEINETMKRVVKFWNDPDIDMKVVGNTCERCPVMDCQDRVADPVKLDQKIERKLKREAIKSLVEQND